MYTLNNRGYTIVFSEKFERSYKCCKQLIDEYDFEIIVKNGVWHIHDNGVAFKYEEDTKQYYLFDLNLDDFTARQIYLTTREFNEILAFLKA